MNRNIFSLSRRLLGAAAIFLPPPLAAQGAPTTDSAQVVEAAEAWFALVDAEQYAASLDSAAPLLRQMAGSVERWRQFLETARSGWPPSVQRRLVLSDPDPEIPAAPPGNYWLLTFEVGAAAAMTETVVLVETPTGWRVAMYGTRGAN